MSCKGCEYNLKKRLIILFSVILILIAAHMAVVTFDGVKDELKAVDAAVILGNKVEENGKPSERLQCRLDRAVELYNKKYFKYVIVSGGVGKEGFDEAKVMKEYLIKQGVPEGKIFMDSQGNNTLLTAKNSKKIMDSKDLKSVMVISQFYHISRTKLAFKKVGFKEVYSAHGKYFELRDIYSLVREVPAYYKYLLY